MSGTGRILPFVYYLFLEASHTIMAASVRLFRTLKLLRWTASRKSFALKKTTGFTDPLHPFSLSLGHSVTKASRVIPTRARVLSCRIVVSRPSLTGTTVDQDALPWSSCTHPDQHHNTDDIRITSCSHDRSTVCIGLCTRRPPLTVSVSPR